MWSGRRVSNSRPIPWQGIALPTELLPRKPGGASRSRTDLHGFAIRCITALLSRRAYLTIGPANCRKAWAPRNMTWSGRRVSNSRPIPWQGIALPTELLPREASAHYKDLRQAVNAFAPGSAVLLAARANGCAPDRRDKATPYACNSPSTRGSIRQPHRSAKYPAIAYPRRRAARDRAAAGWQSFAPPS